MEIIYHWEGDYLIPDLKLSDTTEYQIEKYGRMREFFRREPQGRLFLYAFVGNLMETSCGDGLQILCESVDVTSGSVLNIGYRSDPFLRQVDLK